MKRALFVFCLIGGGCSVYLATNGIVGSGHDKKAFSIDQASVPKHFDQSGDEISRVQQVIDEDLYRQIRTFKVYLDSLHKNHQPGYDSLLLARPGLMDSLTAIEEIYRSQQLK